MVTPAARREAVAHLRLAFEVSERRACSMLGADRTSVRYRSRRPPDAVARARLRELASVRRRFGYRRLHILLSQGVDSRRPPAGPPTFMPGDRVRAKFHSPLGATRLPRYVRGHVGIVESYHGWHRLPDASAHGEEQAEPLYCVGFLARGLWDDVASPGDMVFADLWESYLEPA